MRTVIFHFKDMQSDERASTLQSALSAHPGVQDVTVSFKDRQATVVFDVSVTNENRLASAIEGAGFQVPDGCP